MGHEGPPEDWTSPEAHWAPAEGYDMAKMWQVTEVARFAMWILRCQEKEREIKNSVQFSGLDNSVSGNKSCSIDNETKSLSCNQSPIWLSDTKVTAVHGNGSRKIPTN